MPRFAKEIDKELAQKKRNEKNKGPFRSETECIARNIKA